MRIGVIKTMPIDVAAIVRIGVITTVRIGVITTVLIDVIKTMRIGVATTVLICVITTVLIDVIKTVRVAVSSYTQHTPCVVFSLAASFDLEYRSSSG